MDSGFSLTIILGRLITKLEYKIWCDATPHISG